MKKVVAVLMCLAMLVTISPLAFADPVPTPGDLEIMDYSPMLELLGPPLKPILDNEGRELDIGVWAAVMGGGPTYRIEVIWGSMMFVYNSENTWDPYTHAKSATGDSGWDMSYLPNENEFEEGDNNVITIKNHSEFAIGAVFDYKDSEETPLGGVNAAFSLKQFTETQMNAEDTPLAVGAMGLADPNCNYYMSEAPVSPDDPFKGKAVGKPVMFWPTANEFGNSDNGGSQVMRNRFHSAEEYGDGRVAYIFFALTGTPAEAPFGLAKVGNVLIDFYPCNLLSLNLDAGDVNLPYGSNLDYSRTTGFWGAQ